MIMEVYFMASEVLLNELRSIEEELEHPLNKGTIIEPYVGGLPSHYQ